MDKLSDLVFLDGQKQPSGQCRYNTIDTSQRLVTSDICVRMKIVFSQRL